MSFVVMADGGNPVPPRNSAINEMGIVAVKVLPMKVVREDSVHVC